MLAAQRAKYAEEEKDEVLDEIVGVLKEIDEMLDDEPVQRFGYVNRLGVWIEDEHGEIPEPNLALTWPAAWLSESDADSMDSDTSQYADMPGSIPVRSIWDTRRRVRTPDVPGAEFDPTDYGFDVVAAEDTAWMWQPVPAPWLPRLTEGWHDRCAAHAAERERLLEDMIE